MKKLYIFFLILMFASVADAQNYEKFKLGIGGGLAIGNDGAGFSGGSGVLVTVEPAYRVSDNLAIGLRVEVAEYGKTSAFFL